jgi:hypothetical protein
MAASLDLILSAIQNGVTAIGNIGRTLSSTFPQITGTSSTATTGTCTLTSSQPAGFITVVSTAGATLKIPYYNT